MRHLRFLKRHEAKFRSAIYRAAQFEEFPARTEIFRMGDPADYMYIILKGKVSCQGSRARYPDIPVVLNTKSDGEHFGELSMIDEGRLADSLGKEKDVEVAEKLRTQVRGRNATCITVEETKVLKIECLTASRLL